MTDTAIARTAFTITIKGFGLELDDQIDLAYVEDECVLTSWMFDVPNVSADEIDAYKNRGWEEINDLWNATVGRYYVPGVDPLPAMAGLGRRRPSHKAQAMTRIGCRYVVRADHGTTKCQKQIVAINAARGSRMPDSVRTKRRQRKQTQYAK